MTMFIRMAQAGKRIILGGLLVAFGTTTSLHAEQAFKIYGKAYSVEELAKENQGQFFDIETKKYELISNLARDRYLDEFFVKLAEKDKVSVEKAKTDYLNAKTKVSDGEVKDAMEKFKDYPQLKDRSDADKKKMILDYLQKTKAQEVFEALIAEGRSNAAIAETLIITPGVVTKHIASIFAKLGLPPSDSDNRRVLATLRYLQS